VRGWLARRSGRPHPPLRGTFSRKREKGIEMLRLRRSALLFTSWGKVAAPVSPTQPTRTGVAMVDLRDHRSGIAMSGRRSF
jgi:hypothetical protein